jgi:hypothetical protein
MARSKKPPCRQDCNAATVDLEIGYATPDGVLARYAELLAQKAAKNGDAPVAI